MPADDDVLHGLDGGSDFHHCFRALTGNFGLGRGYVRYTMGRFPGKALVLVRILVLITKDSVDDVRLRSCSYLAQAVRHRVRLHVLGSGHPPFLWSRAGRDRRPR